MPSAVGSPERGGHVGPTDVKHDQPDMLPYAASSRFPHAVPAGLPVEGLCVEGDLIQSQDRLQGARHRVAVLRRGSVADRMT